MTSCWPRLGPVGDHPAKPGALPPNAARDTVTREGDLTAAQAITAAASVALAGADFPFKKIDSLIRGQQMLRINYRGIPEMVKPTSCPVQACDARASVWRIPPEYL